MPEKMKQAILSLIYKKGDNTLIQNYRPISLTNYDYKILAFILSKWIQKVAGKIIHSDQVGYLKGRYISNHIWHMIDIIEYCNHFEKEGAIICLDFKKAFDSLEWNFMFKALEKYNFGENFIKWIKIF